MQYFMTIKKNSATFDLVSTSIREVKHSNPYNFYFSNIRKIIKNSSLSKIMKKFKLTRCDVYFIILFHKIFYGIITGGLMVGVVQSLRLTTWIEVKTMTKKSYIFTIVTRYRNNGIQRWI